MTSFIKFFNRVLVVFLLGLLAALPVQGDTVILKSPKSRKNNILPGRVIKGKLIEVNDKCIVLETFAGIRNIPQERVYKHNPKKTSNFEKYEAQIESLGKDAEGQIKLAEMCEKGVGFQRAREHLNKALELASEDKKITRKIKTLLKRVKRKEEARLKKLPKPRGIIFEVGVKQNLPESEVALSDADFEQIKTMIMETHQARVGSTLADVAKAASFLLSLISDRQLYIKEVIFTIGANKGDMIFDKEFTGMPGGGTNVLVGPSDWYAAGIVHTLGHSDLSLDDDNNAASGGERGKGKYPCIMALNWETGYCVLCRRALKIGEFGKFADLLVEEIPEPPLPKITIKYAKK